MKLYNYFRSSAAFRVRIALNLKDARYEYISKALPRDEHRAGDYLALNPQGLVPALAVDETVLSQSLAIIEYLNDKYPEPALLPHDPLARAQVRSMALTIACDIHPLNNLRVLGYLRQNFGQDAAGVQRARAKPFPDHAQRGGAVAGLNDVREVVARRGLRLRAAPSTTVWPRAVRPRMTPSKWRVLPRL